MRNRVEEDIGHATFVHSFDKMLSAVFFVCGESGIWKIVQVCLSFHFKLVLEICFACLDCKNKNLKRHCEFSRNLSYISYVRKDIYTLYREVHG